MSRTLTQTKRPAILATSVAALLSLGLLWGAPRAMGDEYWDGSMPNNSVANGSGGSGQWDNTVTQNWSDGTGMGAADNFYDPTQLAIFSTAGGTVTLGDNIIFNSLRFDATGYVINPGGGPFTIAAGTAGGSIFVSGTNAVTINAQIVDASTGANVLSLQGAAGSTITLTNISNNYTLGTIIGNAGTGPTVVIDNDAELGQNAGPLTFDGGTLHTTANVTSGRGITIVTSATFQPDPVTTLELDGAIVDGGSGPGSLTMSGTGTLLLTSPSNTYSGGTIINSGTLVISVDGNLGGAAGAITFGGGTLRTTANVTTSRQVTINAGGGTFLPDTGTTLELDSAITDNGPLTMSGAGTLVLGGAVTGTGGVTVNGTGTLLLNNAGNTYGGATTVTSGILRTGAVNAIPSTSSVTVDTGGTLDLNGNSQNVGSIKNGVGGGVITLGAGTLTTGNDNSTTAFSGVISGTGGLTKVGTGVFTLSGANVYTGATTVSAGTLSLTGSLTGSNVSTSGSGNVSESSTGVIGGAGVTFTKGSSGTSTLSGANTYTGATTVNGGTLLIDPTTNPTVLSSSSALVVGGGQFQFNGLATPASQTLNGLTVNSGASVVAIDVTHPGVVTTLDLRGPSMTMGITRNANGFVDFNAIGGTLGTDAIFLTHQANDPTTGIIGTWATVDGGAAFAVNNGSDVIVAYTGYTNINALGPNQIQDGANTNVRINAMGTSGPVSIAQPLTRINSLTQNFTTASVIDTSPGILRVGTNGGIFITPGSAALTIGTAPNSGTLAAGEDTQTVASNLTLENNSGNGSLLTINSVIADNGAASVSVRVDGSGTVVLAGANTYTGSTSIFGGTLSINAVNSIPSNSAVIVDLNGTLNLNNLSPSIASLADGPDGGGTVNLGTGTLTTGNDNTDTTFSGVIQGAGGSLAKVGTGTFTLAGASTYTGATTVSSGTLGLTGSLTGSNVSTSGTGIVSESSTGMIGGAGVTFTQGSSGTSILGGVNTYTGATTVSAGTLSLTGSLTGSNVSTSGTGIVSESSTGVIGGAGVTFTQGSSGTSTLAGANTYAGGTTLSNGTLIANNNSALGTGTLTITSSGGPTTLGSTINNTTIANPISVKGDFSISTSGAGGNFILTGPIDLNGATRTITGLTNGGQPQFNGGISNGGINFNTVFTNTGDYVAFIFNGSANTYTGKTTVNNGAFLVFEGATANGGVKGDLDIEGNGVVDYLAGNPMQLTPTATVTVNSGGNTASGIFFGGLDLFNSSGDTIGTLNGSVNGVVSLGAANLSIGAGDFEGIIFDGQHTGISGGQITKVGAGTLFLSGQNFYTGGTNINAGILQINSDQSLGDAAGPLNFGGGTLEVVAGSVVQGSRPVNLNAAAIVQIDAGSIAEFDGVITGANTLTKTGPGELFLGGNNAATFTGGTILNAGTLGVTSTGTLSAAAGVTTILVNNPTGVATVVNGGTITGTPTAIDATTSAGVKIVNFGTITGKILLGAGANTIVVATQMQPPSPPPVIVFTGNNNTLELAGSSQDTFNVTAAPNFEFLNKVGGGLWTITGIGNFSRGTVISGGTLDVQGNLLSNVVIQPAGTLAGTGIVTGSVINGGMVLPGIPSSVLSPTIAPGRLTVTGNYTQNPGGALVIQINGTGAGQYSQLLIGGHAQLNGGLVLQNDSGKGLKFGQKLTFLTAGAGVSGTFSEVANPFTGNTIVVGKVIYEANDVVLEGVQGSFQSVDSLYHLTPNQKAVAALVDSVASDPREAKLLTYLDKRDLQKLPGDFDLIAPAEMASVFRIGVSLSDVQARNVQRRTADLRAGASGFSTSGFQTTGGPNYSGGLAGASGPNGPEGTGTPPADHRWGTFITGVGDFVHVGSSANATGYDLDTGGITVGADYRLTDHLAVGVTAGYAGTSANLTDNGRVLVNGAKMGAYGTYYTGGFHTDAAVTGGYNSYSTRRGSLQGEAFGSTEGGELDALADAGYDWRLDALTIGPTAAFQYTYVGMDGFTERSSLTPLRYAGQHQTSIRSNFGLRMAYDWKVGGVIVRPEAELSWQHEYGDRSYTIDSALASGAGSLFSVADTQLGRDSFLFGGGVSVLWNPRTSTYLYYDADLLTKEYYSQSVTGGLRMNF